VEGRGIEMNAIEAQTNAYGSHMPVLKKYLADFKPETVFEFGCGDNSTPLFIEHCKSVISVEMQKPDWFTKMLEKHGNKPGFDLLCMMGALAAPEYLAVQAKRYDLIFVDGFMSRWLQINAAIGKTDVIITHDVGQPCYHWERVVLPDGWAWIDMPSFNPWVGVVTNRVDVAEWCNQFTGVLVYKALKDKKYRGEIKC